MRSIPSLFYPLSFVAGAAPLPGATFVYFGTYARPPEAGIYLSVLDVETGQLSDPKLAAAMDQPGFLALHPDGKHLYVVGERASGVARAYAIDRASGALTALNDETSGGAGPCHISLDREGRYAFVANYTAGTAAVLPIGADGRLGAPTAQIAYEGSSVHPERQTKPYAHSANLAPTQRFLYVADLGTDRLMIHRFNSRDGSLSPAEPSFAKLAPGSGPRHFTFHPDGRHAYVINELSCTVTAFEVDASSGALKETQTISTLPTEFAAPNTCAEVVVHPNGRFLYASNRGHDSIAVFAIDGTNGQLTPLGHAPTGGKTPRNFAIAPGGRWLLAANQASNTVNVFAIDAAQGTLAPQGASVHVPTPTCVRFLVTD